MESMDTRTLLKIFKWMLYTMIACGIVCAGILVSLIFAIWSWMS